MNYLKLIIAFLKNNKWALTVLVIVALLGVGFYFGAKAYRSEMQRIENNYLASLAEIRGEVKESNRTYQLTVEEIKKQFPEIKSQLKEMDIKIKDAISVQNVNTTTVLNVHTSVRDSVINDTIVAKIASYSDKWAKFNLTLRNDSVLAKISTKDSLFISLYRQKRTFGEWIRREPKKVESKVKNYSPYSNITFNRYIEIQK